MWADSAVLAHIVMPKRLASLALLLFFAGAGVVSAETRLKGNDAIDKVIREVSERQKKITSLQADFRQEKSMALLAATETSTGTFVFSKPNRVLWTYHEPKPVTMLIANGWLTTYYPELNRAEKIEVRRFEDRIFKYMGAASGAIDELGKYFDFTFVDSKSNRHYTLELKPKTKTVAKRVRRIKIWIDRQSYITSKFEYEEGDGDMTRYEFTNIRINTPVPESQFTLKLPATVKVEQIQVN